MYPPTLLSLALTSPLPPISSTLPCYLTKRAKQKTIMRRFFSNRRSGSHASHRSSYLASSTAPGFPHRSPHHEFNAQSHGFGDPDPPPPPPPYSSRFTQPARPRSDEVFYDRDGTTASGSRHENTPGPTPEEEDEEQQGGGGASFPPLRVSRQQLHNTSNPNIPASASGGTPYACSQAALDELHRFFPGPRLDHPRLWHPKAAIRELQRFLDLRQSLAPDVVAALERIKAGMQHGRNVDVLVKALPDVDVAFFHGHLTGSVKVRWSNPRYFAVLYRQHGSPPPVAPAFGYTNRIDLARAAVNLDLDRICFEAEEPMKGLWGAVVQELVGC